MVERDIKRFQTWREPKDESESDIIGASRQISHLAGINLEPKGRFKTNGSSASVKFSIRPKPLKWPGSCQWNRASIIIKSDGGSISFIAMVDGTPISLGPTFQWQPIKNARPVIEKIYDKIIKE